jgi:hypothetical protein
MISKKVTSIPLDEPTKQKERKRMLFTVVSLDGRIWYFSKKNWESKDVVNVWIHKECTIFYLVYRTIKKAKICKFFLAIILSIPKKSVVLLKPRD